MLSVMSWNVKHTTPMAVVIPTLQSLIRQHNLDVICLQEIVPLSIVPLRRNLHRALTQATGWNSGLACHPSPFPGWIEGVSLLSRLEVRCYERFFLSPRRRYLQAIVADPDLGAVCVGSIHLSTPKRREQELRGAIAHAPASRFVLAGDLNLELDDPRTDALRDRYVVDGLPGVDHICLSRDLGFAGCKVVQTHASDHDPVVAVVEFASGVEEQYPRTGLKR